MLSEELIKAIENGKLSHAYLFTDRAAALEFAEKLAPGPLDLSILKPSDGRVHILSEDIERLRSEIKYKSFGERRVVFIENADSMQTAAQNKLLKTLEEPLGNTVMILCAERRDAMLPTVLSRCVEIACPDRAPEPGSEAESLAAEFYEKKRAGAEFFELKALLSPIIDDKDNGRERALAFLDAFENLLREELLGTFDAAAVKGAVMLTEETRKNIKASFSVAYALKAFALNI